MQRTGKRLALRFQFAHARGGGGEIGAVVAQDLGNHRHPSIEFRQNIPDLPVFITATLERRDERCDGQVETLEEHGKGVPENTVREPLEWREIKFHRHSGRAVTQPGLRI